MTQEEKAKRYDEAKINGSRLWECGEITRENYEYMFPEIKDSGDERIRESLLEYLHTLPNHYAHSGVCAPEWIAWLEKQGEHTKFYDSIQVGDKVTRNQDGVLVNLSQLKRVAKPTDNVEPKFHEGDWIVHHGTENIYQVVARIDNQYQLKYGDNYTIQNCVDVDRCSRLYDVAKDAKDGDVLATLDHILIFEKLLPKDGGVSYCHYDFGCSTPQFNFNKDDNWYFGKEAKVYPATKEQHDTLMKAMADAGYTFDFEKKELKKIEQKPANKVESKFKVGDHIKPIDKCLGSPRIIEEVYDGWYVTDKGALYFEFEDNWELVEQKPAWSEEDEEKLNLAIRCVHYKEPANSIKEDTEVYDNTISWLKSLKDRVQPKQEWSEEDKTMLCYMEGHLEYLKNDKGYSSSEDQIMLKRQLNWLKSLRPQKQLVTDEELSQAEKDAYRDALDKIEYHSGEPTFDDGWSAAIWYLKKRNAQPQNTWKPSDEHYELEEFAKIVRSNLTGISKAVQKLFEAKYLQLTGNKMYGGYKD